MSGIAIVTDSTSDISDDVVEEFGVTVVPLSVTIDGETFVDGQLTQEQFFARMKAAPELPKTSQPAPEAFRQAYSHALENSDDVVSIHISEKLSGTIGSAREAAEDYGGRVHVVDSGTLSWGLAWQVLEAARAVARGVTVPEVLDAVEKVGSRVQLIVEVDSLENLAKGGRIGKVANFLGTMLNLRVIFHVRDGEFLPLYRARGSEAAINRCLEWVEKEMEGRHRGAFCVLSACATERAQRIGGLLQNRFEVAELRFQEVGTVIASHTGSAFGIAFVPLD